MKAWKITAPNTMEPYESGSEKAGAGQVKIKVRQYLLAKPDLQTYLGLAGAAFPVIPGNSCCGMVIETGEGVETFKRGDRVYIHPQKYCGECTACRTGKYTKCENLEYFGVTCDGFLRDFAVVRTDNCIKIPERIADDEAVFLDYIAIAAQAMSAINAQKGDFVAISGATTLGIILGQVALYYQAVPILVDMNAANLEIASNMGIYYTVDASKTDPVGKIMHLTGGKMAECAAHMSSGNVPISTSIGFVGRNGTLAVVDRSVYAEDLTCSLLPVLRNNIEVLGINNGAKQTRTAVNMLANKAVTVLPFITEKVGYDDVPALFERSAKKASSPTKTIVKID